MAMLIRRLRTLRSVGILAGFFLLVLALPLQPSVRVDLVRYGILALSVYLPLRAGQLSLASPGFYAMGGYVAAIVSTRYVRLDDETGFWKLRAMGRTWTFSRELYDIRLVLLEFVIAAFFAAILGVVIGYMALRLSGIYLALATIAFVECFRLITLDLPIFGGATGIFDIPQPFDSQLGYLWLALPILIGALWFVFRQERSRVGRALVAINEDELASSATGIHPTYYKVLAFTQGAVLAALAGVISAHTLNTWNARQGTFEAATLMLACVVIGGSRTFVGPVVGGFVLTAIPELLRWVADRPFLPKSVSEPIKNGRPFVYGLLMVLVCIYFSQGLATPRLIDRLFPRRARNSGVITEEVTP